MHKKFQPLAREARGVAARLQLAYTGGMASNRAKKLDLARRILAGRDDFEVYMMAAPTRGPGRLRELTREELTEYFARAHTLDELRTWAYAESR